MQDFKSKVAVITGAASGIGYALAKQCGEEGMKVVLADINEETLANVKEEFQLKGIEVLALTIDVSNEKDIKFLAEETYNYFGSIDMMFNNAGVETGSLLWNTSQEAWQWVLGVNLWGIIHSIRIILPLMMEQNTSCYMINTASRVGLESGLGIGAYRVSKHAIVGLTETLYHELNMIRSNVQVSVLCPGYVQTSLHQSIYNAPELSDGMKSKKYSYYEKKIEKINEKAMLDGISPTEVAIKTFEEIRKGCSSIERDHYP